jgi:hypothetical protein
MILPIALTPQLLPELSGLARAAPLEQRASETMNLCGSGYSRVTLSNGRQHNHVDLRVKVPSDTSNREVVG